MNDVTAVVLSIGEKTTQRAIDSLKNQTLKPGEIILIENISPSYRAGNIGASRVKTEFLVMVGSDFILDNDCIEKLRRCMKDGVGIVTGHLTDALIGRTVGVRMYRKICFDIAKNTDSVSPDTDFRESIYKKGWKIIYALKYNDGKQKYLWHTFGSHKPVYTRLYTFSKFRIEGRRYRYWNNLKGMIWKFSRLNQSRHPMKFVAQIAMGHGFFMKHENDLLNKFVEDEESLFLKDFIKTKEFTNIKPDINIYDTKIGYYNIFDYYYKLGHQLRNSYSYLNFKEVLGELAKSENIKSLVARLGLCHGIFAEVYLTDDVVHDYLMIEPLIQHT